MFHSADGELRAPWRLIIFALLTIVALIVFVGVAFALFQTASVVTSAEGVMATSLAMACALIVSHAVMLRWVERAPWATVGLGRSDARPALLGRGFLLGALAIGIPSVMLLGAHLLRADASPGTPDQWWRFAGTLTLMLLPAALWEELAFRGYFFAVLRREIGAPGALAVTSVLFGLIHAANPHSGIQPVLLVTLAGVFLGSIVLATGSLYAAWVAHFAWNWVMAVLLHTDVSGFLPSPPPEYRVVDAGPDWITGGPWGPEGGAAAGLGMLSALGLLFARRARREDTETDT